MRAAKYVTMMDPFSTKYGARMGGMISTTAIMGTVLYCASILTALGIVCLCIVSVRMITSLRHRGKRCNATPPPPPPIPDVVSLNANRGDSTGKRTRFGVLEGARACCAPLWIRHCNRDVRVQISIWVQTFCSSRNSFFQTVNALEDIFSGFSDCFRPSDGSFFTYTLSHPCNKDEIVLKSIVSNVTFAWA